MACIRYTLSMSFIRSNVRSSSNPSSRIGTNIAHRVAQFEGSRIRYTNAVSNVTATNINRFAENSYKIL